MSEIDRFFERFLLCKRQIDYVTLANDVANALSPNEMVDFYAQVQRSKSSENRANFAKVAHGWVRFRRKGRWRNSPPSEFVSSSVSAGVRLFQSSGQVTEKTMLILVGGSNGRIMVPTTLFLDSLPQVPMDVVLLKSDRDLHFRLGVEGFAASLVAVAAELKRHFKTRDYARLVVMGMSSGGMPALAIANAISADLGIAIDGRLPNDLFRLRRRGRQMLSAFYPICACMGQSAGHLIGAFGAGSEIDVHDAHLAQKSFGKMELLSVPGSNAHGLLRPVFTQGELPNFLGLVLNLTPRRQPSNGIWSTLTAVFHKR